VVAVAPHLAAEAERAVDGAGNADREALEATRERASALGLDDEVHVVGLDGEVNHMEAFARRHGKGATNDWEDPLPTERG
jgi:nucleotide-binding universal stress UspA family protein